MNPLAVKVFLYYYIALAVSLCLCKVAGQEIRTAVGIVTGPVAVWTTAGIICDIVRAKLNLYQEKDSLLRRNHDLAFANETLLEQNDFLSEKIHEAQEQLRKEKWSASSLADMATAHDDLMEGLMESSKEPRERDHQPNDFQPQDQPQSDEMIQKLERLEIEMREENLREQSLKRARLERDALVLEKQEQITHLQAQMEELLMPGEEDQLLATIQRELRRRRDLSDFARRRASFLEGELERERRSRKNHEESHSKDLQDIYDTHERKMAEAKVVADQLNAQISQLKQDIRLKDHQLSSLKEKVNEQEEVCIAMQSVTRKLQEENHALRKEKAGLLQRIEKMNRDNRLPLGSAPLPPQPHLHPYPYPFPPYPYPFPPYPYPFPPYPYPFPPYPYPIPPYPYPFHPDSPPLPSYPHPLPNKPHPFPEGPLLSFPKPHPFPPYTNPFHPDSPPLSLQPQSLPQNPNPFPEDGQKEKDNIHCQEREEEIKDIKQPRKDHQSEEEEFLNLLRVVLEGCLPLPLFRASLMNDPLRKHIFDQVRSLLKEIFELKNPIPLSNSPPRVPSSPVTDCMPQRRNKTMKECKEAFPPMEKTLPEVTKKFIEGLGCLGIPLVCMDGVLSQDASVIGEGACAKCYRYQFADLDKPSIIKVYKKIFVTEHEILREITMLQQLKDIDGTPCVQAVAPIEPYAVIMDDGGNITWNEWLLKSGRLHREALEMLKRICEVLAKIHLKQVAHTDLHGKNIVIDGETNQPTIVDFGVAAHFGHGDPQKDVNNLYMLLDRCNQLLEFPSPLKQVMWLENTISFGNRTLPQFVKHLDLLLDILDQISQGPENKSRVERDFTILKEINETVGNKVANLEFENFCLHQKVQETTNLLKESKVERDNLKEELERVKAENTHLKQLAWEAEARQRALEGELSGLKTTSTSTTTSTTSRGNNFCLADASLQETKKKWDRNLEDILNNLKEFFPEE